MIGAFIITFREVIEAGLIVGIVLAATQGLPGRSRSVALGVAGGLGGAGLAALFTEQLSNAFAGTGQDLLSAAVLISAVLMLVWHNTWMSRHGRKLAGELRTAGEAVRSGRRSAAALAVVVGAAILREGAELVLFLYGLVASGASGAELELGALAGVGAGILVSAASYFGLASVPSRYLFAVTSTLVVFLAAGLAAQAAQFLSNADVVTILDQPLWNSAGLLAEASLPGRALHALIGYTERPTVLQGLVYFFVIGLMLALMHRGTSRGRQVRGA